MTDTTREDRRDEAIRAMLPLVAEQGWSRAALVAAAGEAGVILFPGGPAEMVEAYIDMADRDMVAAYHAHQAEEKLSRRVRGLIVTRLRQASPYRGAVRRALGVLARPSNAAVAVRCTARTVDAIWQEAGDTSADFSWYTKRAILAGVYSSTLLFWIARERDEADMLAFLDRRLGDVARIGKLRARLAT